ncbi:hypothetical protein [Spirochaeta africana]|uniref:Uncharacterized protein n=1 Tax=Spirochaeta africana (strain ATCC 700263 / DSM 8902 / Z-7692) TaxID=889378 RepID=H9UH75_SPIAZ|nr:hypothetical protein [Spirochaeta africana]AFG36868.1 hypothetical protein Spiaf_0774 [Spirochaeta africana DSM 8902]
MRRILIAVIIAAVAALSVGAQEAETEPQEQNDTGQQAEIPADADGSLRLTNIDTSGWRVDQVDGAGIHVSGANQSNITLALGNRYHFDLSDTDSDLLPLVIRDRTGRPIFSQADPDGGLGWSGSDPVIGDDGITFTLTEELAEVIGGFRAVTFPAMYGFITAYDPEAVAEQQAAAAEAAEDASDAPDEAAAADTEE